MEQEILPANIEDEGDMGPGLCNVGKVLLGTDTEVNSVAYAKTPEAAQDLQVGGFVGDQVVGIEEPWRFGKALNETEIIWIREALRSLPGKSSRRAKPEENRNECDSDNQFRDRHWEQSILLSRWAEISALTLASFLGKRMPEWRMRKQLNFFNRRSPGEQHDRYLDG